MSRYSIIMRLGFSLLLSLYIIVGNILEVNQGLVINVKYICYYIICVLVCYFVLFYLEHLGTNKSICKINLNKIKFYHFIIIQMFIWLIFFIGIYPGYFNYDAPGQWLEFNNNSLTEHHPVVHPVLIGICLTLGIIWGWRACWANTND